MRYSDKIETQAEQRSIGYVHDELEHKIPAEPSGGVNESLCGTTVSVQTGTVEADDLVTLNKKCTQAGKPKIKSATFQKQDDAYLALASGRADAAFADSPVNSYAVTKSQGKFQEAGGPSPAQVGEFIVRQIQGARGYDLLA